MTDQEKTPETLLTVEIFRQWLCECEAWCYKQGDTATGDALAWWRALTEKPLATPTPSKPPAKYKEDDWVLTTQGPIPHQFIGDDRHGGHMLRSLFGNVSGGWSDDELLPIPPKPDKVQQGYKLTGVVEVADGSKPYVVYSLRGAGPVGTTEPADKAICGGRRWMVELDPVTETKPEPQYKKGDWVVAQGNPDLPMRVEGRGRWSHTRWEYPVMVYDADGDRRYQHWEETLLLPIPPKPTAIHGGRALTGQVLDSSSRTPESLWVTIATNEWKVHYIGKGNEPLIGCDGRRWELQSPPLTCPRCHKELSHD